MGRKIVYTQDKDIDGPLSKTTVNSVIEGFTSIFNNSKKKSSIAGFELNGGEGLTKGATALWEAFTKQCRDRGMDAEYNSKPDLLTIRDNLRSRVNNKNR